MSATDELRRIAAKTECANGRCEKLYRGDLDHIADRIDERYKRDMATAQQVGYNEGEDAAMRSEWVKLPVDADGVPIHVGDVMEWPDGSTFDVVGISANTLFYVEHDFDDSAQWTAAHNKRHHQPDSWERIIEDAANYEHDGWEGSFKDFVDGMVERCERLAGR